VNRNALGFQTKTNPKDSAVMVFIPAGDFQMGDDDMVQRGNPRRTVSLPGFWMYRDLVTVGMYKRFCQETNRQMPAEPVFPADNHFNQNWSKEDHPIVDVSWNDAMAYCNWAGVTLPSDAEWEKAARGVDARKFPWGNTMDQSKLWSHQTVGTHRVGELAVSPSGCTDMAGNVFQWCVDLWTEGRTEVNARGGSWSVEGNELLFRAACRYAFGPDRGSYDVGFRCAAPQ
jgi:serine/threonine-protein kinase